MTEPAPSPVLRVIHAGHTPLTAGERATLEDFIVQPAAPWFSEGERLFLSRALAGEFSARADDFFFFLSVDGRPVAHAWYPVSRRQPEIAVLGYVLTDPAFRGQGLSARVCGALVEHFDRRGGRVMYLGTGNPAARRIYLRQGFTDYCGHVMRRVSVAADVSGCDARLFAPAAGLALRPAEWSDVAPGTALYTVTAPWVARDVTEGIFLPPGGELLRCVSIFVALKLRSERRGHWLEVLETGSGRMVGCVSRVAAENGDRPVLELMLHPNFAAAAAPILRERLAGERGWVSYAAPADAAKAALLRELGFRESPDTVLRSGHTLRCFHS